MDDPMKLAYLCLLLKMLTESCNLCSVLERNQECVHFWYLMGCLWGARSYDVK